MWSISRGWPGRSPCTLTYGMAFSPAPHMSSRAYPRSEPLHLPHRNPSYFHLHLVSDSTGETLTTVAHAAAAQYAHVSPIEHVYPLIRTQKQLDRVLSEIEEAPGIVLYTLLDEELIERLEKKCAELSLPCRSILGPVLRVFQSYLGGDHDAAGRRPAHPQCRIFQAHRRAQLHDAA